MHTNTPGGPMPEDFRRQLSEDDLGLFTALRVTELGRNLITIANDPGFDDWTFSAKIRYALNAQIADKQERRTQKLLKASQTPDLAACIEDVRYLPDRNLGRETVHRLASCRWIEQGSNLVIIGATSVGKTYLALALLNQACRNDYNALFYRASDLLLDAELYQSTSLQAFADFRSQLRFIELLVIDDFLTTPVNDGQAAFLFELLSHREQVKASTLVTSQLDPKGWYDSIPDKVQAESIISRVVGGAEILTIKGPNQRTTPTKP